MITAKQKNIATIIFIVKAWVLFAGGKAIIVWVGSFFPGYENIIDKIGLFAIIMPVFFYIFRSYWRAMGLENKDDEQA